MEGVVGLVKCLLYLRFQRRSWEAVIWSRIASWSGRKWSWHMLSISQHLLGGTGIPCHPWVRLHYLHSRIWFQGLLHTKWGFSALTDIVWLAAVIKWLVTNLDVFFFFKSIYWVLWRKRQLHVVSVHLSGNMTIATLSLWYVSQL